MKRISDELFVTGENRTYSLDDVIAIRIQDGEFYFLGWMENAERYSFSGQNQILRLKGIF